MSAPKCPNHSVTLDKTDNKRIWICPRSSWKFEVNVAETEKGPVMAKDRMGNLTQVFAKVEPEGGTEQTMRRVR